MLKIKRIITALGNKNISFEKYKEKITQLCSDIQYKEGILEYLELNPNVDYIIINENIPGEINTEELITEIKTINHKIRIILISKNNKVHENVYRIFNEYKIEKIIGTICKEEKIYNQKTIPINNFFNEETKDGEIITILGSNGIGKSIFSITYASNIQDKKILIIDFDIINNNMHNLLGVEQYSKKIRKNKNIDKERINISDFIINTKLGIDLISGLNLIFNYQKQPSPNKIRNLINNIRESYDLIIIDTSSECFLEYTKELIKISNQSIFISGANTLEIKKSQKLLEIYDKEWEIPKEKIKIIFNKCTKKSIDDEILKQIFNKYEILGKIRLNDYYDLAINKNNSKQKEIQKDITVIKNRMVRKKIIRRRKNGISQYTR